MPQSIVLTNCVTNVIQRYKEREFMSKANPVTTNGYAE